MEAFDRAIDLRITRLRRKIEADPAHPDAIRTVRGVGYMFVPPKRLRPQALNLIVFRIHQSDSGFSVGDRSMR